MRSKTIVALLVAILLSLCISRNSSEASNEADTTYEYKVLTMVDVKQLNDAGAQGWELVSVTPIQNGPTYLYLKRLRKTR